MLWLDCLIAPGRDCTYFREEGKLQDAQVQLKVRDNILLAYRLLMLLKFPYMAGMPGDTCATMQRSRVDVLGVKLPTPSLCLMQPYKPADKFLIGNEPYRGQRIVHRRR